ncbi:MAG: SRPBCC domain-containing protein [Bradyrhizobium sp.]|nr:MAG: SRPBCC domain-containing protein [Bradyrhizobium sp.]
MKTSNGARALADLDEGLILAAITIAAPPERVFRAIASDEITKWWGSDQVYRVTRWTSDLRVGGSWRSEGVGADGTAFSVQGEYLEIDPPRKLVQTWSYDWGDKLVTKLTYRISAIPEGVKLVVRHEGFKGRREDCASHEKGWETVLTWLSNYLTRTGA